jgi:hypothetical protein
MRKPFLTISVLGFKVKEVFQVSSNAMFLNTMRSILCLKVLKGVGKDGTDTGASHNAPTALFQGFDFMAIAEPDTLRYDKGAVYVIYALK